MSNLQVNVEKKVVDKNACTAKDG